MQHIQTKLIFTQSQIQCPAGCACGRPLNRLRSFENCTISIPTLLPNSGKLYQPLLECEFYFDRDVFDDSIIFFFFSVSKTKSKSLFITGVIKALLTGSKTSGASQKSGKKTNQMVSLWLSPNPTIPKGHGITRHTLHLPTHIRLWVSLPRQATHPQVFLSCPVRPAFLPQRRTIRPRDPFPTLTEAPPLMATSLPVLVALGALALSHTSSTP